MEDMEKEMQDMKEQLIVLTASLDAARKSVNRMIFFVIVMSLLMILAVYFIVDHFFYEYFYNDLYDKIVGFFEFLEESY